MLNYTAYYGRNMNEKFPVLRSPAVAVYSKNHQNDEKERIRPVLNSLPVITF